MEPLPRARTRTLACAAFALALALAAPGCAIFRPRPPARPRPAPGYVRLRDTLDRVDASGLAGRRIALDPGHGGIFRGAMGVHGLAEAEVNLAVALRLRDLLAAKGAEVFLTRATDRDFATPADSSLRSDLAERARLAAGFDPDLFVSIHHNADPRGAHDVNETQTYYKLGDEGPSLDAAQDVHRALVRNLGIAANRILPGNFYVLRTSPAPALLTEGSYVTNPDVEERLRRPEKQELEAEALYVGLARYFARRVPAIEAFAARDPAAPAESLSFVDGDPVLAATVRGAFDRASLVVDGARVEPVREGARLWWRPAIPWSHGHHEAALSVRLSGEGASRERRVGFDVTRRWAELRPEPMAPYELGPDHPVLALRVCVLDRWGRVVRDSGRVALARASGTGISPAETTLVARDGVAWGYLRRDGARATRAALYRVSVPGDPEVPAATVPVAASGADAGPGRTDDPAWTGFARGMPGDTALASAPGTGEPEPRVPWLNRDGFAVLRRDPGGAALAPQLPGFRAWGADSALPPRYVAIAGGALQGRRVVLDPEGGGDDAAGQGPGGTRAAALDLECARALAGFLAAAGAEVRLTRDGDLALSDVERVQASEAFRADRFLRISHHGPARLGGAPGSAAGAAWARATATEMARLGLAAPPVAEEAQFVIQQTSCPALLACPAGIGGEAAETRLLAPGAVRAEAYALFVGLARSFAPSADWPADSLAVRDTEGRPVAGAAVTLGGAIVLVTDGAGRARFARTEPGPIEARVRDSRATARAVLLDSDRGAVLTGISGR